MLSEIDKDMKDALFLDAMEDIIIHFNDQQKAMIENIVNLMSKGEDIEVSYIEKATNKGG
jgi:hypothetical protein